MRILTLMENSPGRPDCAYEHGLSFYIETERRRVLSDTGASAAFLGNADALGVDLGRVDAVFLSHGHYDHAGGVLSFVRRNPRAPIYVQRTAVLPYYSMNDDANGSGGGDSGVGNENSVRSNGGNGNGESGDNAAAFHYIGMDPDIAKLPQIVLLDGDTEIDGELLVIANITGRRYWPASNLRLKRREGGRYVQDSFDHEQALAVRQEGRYYLFSGCAHNGILNVLDRFRQVCGRNPDAVFSGFHFMKKGPYTAEEEEVIRAAAREMAGMDTVFYSGHCTGRRAFAMMEEIMGGQLRALHSGMEILVEP